MSGRLLSRLLLGLVHHALPGLPRLYVPGLGQAVEAPASTYSTFLEVFVRDGYKPLAPLPANARVLDLGANLGMTCLYLAGIMRGGRITAVEASPRTFPLLQRNLDRLRRRTGIAIDALNVAVADARGELTFWEDATRSANVANTAFRDIGGFADAGRFTPLRVPAVTLRDLLDGPVDFLKCDVEGAEYRILTPDLIAPARIAQLAVEFHDTGRNREAFAAIIDTALRHGYVVHDRDRGPVTDVSGPLEAACGDDARVLHFCDPALLGRG